MTRTFHGSLWGCLFFVVSAAQAGMMYGPAIVGTAPGGAEVQVFADDGDGILNPSDPLIKTVTANADGEFSVSDLDMSKGYFLSSSGDVSELTTIGDIKKIIDSFDITQSVISNPISGSRMNSTSGPYESILGGYRDLYVEVLEGQAEAKLRVNPFSQNSNLQIDMTAGTKGMIGVTWDGKMGTEGMEPDDGLNMDFTAGGLLAGVTLGLAVDRAGEGQLLKLAMHSESGMSLAEIEFPYDPFVDPATQTRYIPFSDFEGSADPTQVTAFQMMIEETMPSLDAQVNVIGLTGPESVSLVPEPTIDFGLAAVGAIALLRTS